MPREDIYYSDKYTDDIYEYRHVIVPKKLAKFVLLPTLFLISSVFFPQHDPQDTHHVWGRVARARGSAESWLGRLHPLFCWRFNQLWDILWRCLPLSCKILNTIIIPQVHYMLHGPEPHILLFRWTNCFKLLYIVAGDLFQRIDVDNKELLWCSGCAFALLLLCIISTTL